MAKNQKANACARGCKAAAGHSLLLLIWDSVGQSKELFNHIFEVPLSIMHPYRFIQRDVLYPNIYAYTLLAIKLMLYKASCILSLYWRTIQHN